MCFGVQGTHCTWLLRLQYVSAAHGQPSYLRCDRLRLPGECAYLYRQPGSEAAICRHAGDWELDIADIWPPGNVRVAYSDGQHLQRRRRRIIASFPANSGPIRCLVPYGRAS